jgi:uncharacterized SAM-binding protein YcdF (DUF218 family)
MEHAGAIAILGKNRGTKRENRELDARIALAAALWHADGGRPFLMYVAGHDLPAVRDALLRYGISADRLLLRRMSNCTWIEVRAFRDLCRDVGAIRLLAVTHPYHARRTRDYLREVGLDAEVIPVREDAAAALVLPAVESARFADLADVLRCSRPGPFDAFREAVVEGTLTAIHAVDPGGNVERALANLVRIRPPAGP